MRKNLSLKLIFTKVSVNLVGKNLDSLSLKEIDIVFISNSNFNFESNLGLDLVQFRLK